MNNGSLKNRQQGMTLIEIMVALMLGAFLLAGVMQIFLSSKQTYRIQDNMSRMQENGRFAMEFISRDIRMADYKECFSDISIGGEVFGSDNLGLNGSDRITVLQKDDDCTPGNPDVFSAITFFINADTSGQPALYRVTATGSTVPLTTVAIDTAVPLATANQVLIEGIESMQILYGEDTDLDGTPNYYVDADAGDGVGGDVVDMDEVVSVKITLTVRSLDNNLTNTGDGRLRRTFSSTIVLRNRLN